MTRFIRQARISMLVLGACVLANSGVADEASTARADQIKAAYLFNFVKFIEWPADAAREPIEICFVGASGVHASLQSATADKRVGARPVVVRRLSGVESPGDCSVVYFEAGAVADNQTLLQKAREKSLTVSDAQNFTRSGGAIQLFTEENRLRFVINVENARGAGIRISSNLLKLASNVEQDGAP
jgi:hypothetical protein